ncbi:MAG: tetratricopeptide repeat protein [Candidatus Marinimicrobia bacterium]|nr:tetratricopeptide repeat protein [Candidatus Neomarinimicrobiota bacterium]
MKKVRKIEFISVCILIISLLFIFSCDRPGDDIKIPTGVPPTVEYLVEQGWEAYEAGDYSDAKSQFVTAINRDVFYKEAYLGLGWSMNRLSDYSNAIPKYDLLLTLVDETDTELEILSYAGKALSYAGLNSDSLSCLQSELYLDIADQGFVFTHDSRVTTDKIKILLLNGYWNYQKYYGVQNTIIDRFESDWFTNLVASDDNLSEMTDISAIITVEIEIDTNVTPHDTTIVSAKIEIDDSYNLMEIGQVNDDITANSYPVKRFVHGRNVIYINTDEMDDISMLLDDLTQAVNVDFINAQDYGKYLNTLMNKMQSLY